MPAIFQALPWDSKLMGFATARLTLEDASATEISQRLAECRAAGLRLVYVFVPPVQAEANEAMRAAGAWLADRKVTFTMPLTPTDAQLPADPAIELTSEFTPHLEALAWQSGEYSRFRLDPRLPATVFQRLYTRWLRNSLNGRIAQGVLVFQGEDGPPLGLITLSESNGKVAISLVAVDAAARGQRVGQRLVTEARRRASTLGHTSLQVVTQGANAAACRFYEHCGFQLVQEVNVYHLWLP